jgi:DNA-binding NarL/FixJ family response regulator
MTASNTPAGPARQPRHTAGPSKVLAVGNSQKFIEKISRLLAGRDSVELLCGARDRAEAAERAVLLKPDVIVIDINLDYELGGIDTAFALRRIAPSTAFVLISPFSDPERLSMVPRGLGLEWSYLLESTAEDGEELTKAVRNASWSIPYIDPHIDRRQVGQLQGKAQQAVTEVMRTPGQRGRAAKKFGSDWHGDVENFRLPGDGAEGGPHSA